MHLLNYDLNMLGYDQSVTVGSVYFDIMFYSSLSMSIAMIAYADRLSATRNPMATGSGSQRQISFRECSICD